MPHTIFIITRRALKDKELNKILSQKYFDFALLIMDNDQILLKMLRQF